MTAALALLLAACASAQTVFTDHFQEQDGLVANAYAVAHATEPGVARSPDWEVTSGSLLVQRGVGWTGVPDDTPPNVGSTNGTGSAVFRLFTARGDFQDAAFSFDLLNAGLTTSSSTPAVAWDGAHAVARYQSEDRFYYFSLNRRDETALIKKKAGPSFYDLSRAVPAAVPYGNWQKFRVTVQDGADGSVALTLWRDGNVIVQAVDRGTAGPPIRYPGRFGIRGDNANLKFGHVKVEPVAAPLPAAVAGPVVSGAVAGDVLETQATISWSTDQKATGRVLFGPTASYGMETLWTTEPDVRQSVVLYGLQAGTNYHYKIEAKGLTGSVSPSPDLQFQTPIRRDTTPPTILIVSPASGQTVSGTVPLVCRADDELGGSGIAGVLWQVDGFDAGPEVVSPPYTFMWNATPYTKGPHTIKAFARDKAGNRTVSAPVTITNN